eukprot:CAMPEP_0203763080 /NCGR_PEP_ID=MMETSP0098-20131031/15778_1 /ASSEMBLY_ACC=CAM_ASM_000208 /TAXON_ID=96639 /ORGANISM=" , Strain NY0313808BC1" /LENGTH=1600 /DNA_ID=CAMNT_0050657683 /DNA_START=463 /DNA_END=5266 /DNA_ORIENTATION=-
MSSSYGRSFLDDDEIDGYSWSSVNDDVNTSFAASSRAGSEVYRKEKTSVYSGENVGGHNPNDDFPVASSWKSALVVSSLHKAYNKLVNENHGLRESLRASEERCEELLKIGADENESDNLLLDNPEDSELEKVKKTNETLEKKVEELEEQLEALKKWKVEHLARERNALDSLRKALDDTNIERTQLVNEMSGLRVTVSTNKDTFERFRASASKLIANSLRRWIQAVLQHAWKTWCLHTITLGRNARERVEQKKTNMRREVGVRNALIRIRFRVLHISFSQWHGASSDAIRKRLLVQRHLGHVMHRVLAKCFLAWSSKAHKRIFLRRFIKKTVAYTCHRALLDAFQDWERNTRQTWYQDRFRKLQTEYDEKMECYSSKCWARSNFENARFVLRAWNKTVVDMRSNRRNATFASWKTVVKAKVRKRRILNRHHTRRMKLHCTNVFATWKENAHKIGSERRIVSKFVRKFQNRSLDRAFSGWKNNVRNIVEKRSKAATVFRAIAADSLANRFFAWKEYTQLHLFKKKIEQQHAVALARFVAMWKNRVSSRGFMAWTSFVSRRTFVRRILTRATLHWANQNAFAAFRTWRTHTLETIQIELAAKARFEASTADRLKRRVLTARNQYNLLKSKVGLSIIPMSYSPYDKLLLVNPFYTEPKTIIRYWQHPLAGKAFKQFRIRVIEERNQREIKKLFLQKWTNRMKHRGWGAWVQFTSKRRFLRRVIRGLVNAHERALISRGFRSWYHTTRKRFESVISGNLEEKDETIYRMKSQIVHLEEERTFFNRSADKLRHDRQAILQYVSGRMCRESNKKLLRAAFDGIKIFLRNKRIVNKFVMRMKDQKSSAALNAWVAYSREKKRKRLVIQRVRVRLGSRVLAKSFNSWQIAVLERKQIKEKMKKFFNRQQHLMSWKCFSRWAEFVQERKDIKSRARNVFAVLPDELVATRFNQWVRYTQNSRQERIQGNHYEKVVRRVVFRMQGRLKSACFVSWAEYVREKATSRQRMKRFLLIWRNRMVSRIFQTWLEFKDDKIWLRQWLTCCLKRVHNTKLAIPFIHWAQVTKELQRMELENTKKSLENAQKELNQALWDKQAVESVFGDQIEALTQHRNKIRDKYANTVISNWQNQTVLKLFRVWSVKVTERKVSRCRVTRFVFKYTKKLLAKAFAGWAHNVQRKRRNRFLVHRGIAGVRRRTTFRSFQSWKKLVWFNKEARRALNLMELILTEFRMSAISKAWRKWYYCVFVEMRQESLEERLATVELTTEQLRELCLKKAISTWTRPLLVRSFICWKSNMFELRAQRSRVFNAMMRWKLKMLAVTVRTWRNFTVNRRERKRKLAQLLSLMSHQKQAQAFRTWRTASFSRMVLEIQCLNNGRLILSSLQKFRRGSLARNFRVWARMTTLVKNRRKALTRLNLYFARIRCSIFVPAMNKWKLITLEARSGVEVLNSGATICESMQHALSQVVSNGILFPFTFGGDDELDHVGAQSPDQAFEEDSSWHSGTFHRTHSSNVRTIWSPISIGVGRAALHLFESDSIRLYECSRKKIKNYCAKTGDVIGTYPLGTSITGHVVTTGRVIALRNALVDPDTMLWLMAAGGKQQLGVQEDPPR